MLNTNSDPLPVANPLTGHSLLGLEQNEQVTCLYENLMADLNFWTTKIMLHDSAFEINGASKVQAESWGLRKAKLFIVLPITGVKGLNLSHDRPAL